MSADIDATLAERGDRYGAFPEHARITQNIKRAMADSPNWERMSSAQRKGFGGPRAAHNAGVFCIDARSRDGDCGTTARMWQQQGSE
jgi:hypothetical protein